MNETEDHQIDGRKSVASVDQPTVLAVELRHITHPGPGAKIVAAMPGAINRNRRDRHGRGASGARRRRNQKTRENTNQYQIPKHTHLLMVILLASQYRER